MKSTFFTGIAAMLVDAWHELRVNRVRILLALVGIFVAVVGLTAAIAGGQLLLNLMQESAERAGGRTSTVVAQASSPAAIDRLHRLPNDFGITKHAMAVVGTASVWTPVQQFSVSLWAVEPEYAEIYRTVIEQGRFLTDEDASNLAPAIVANHTMWEALGAPDLRTHPTVSFVDGTGRLIGVLVGVTAPQGDAEQPQAWMPYARADLMPDPPVLDAYGVTPQPPQTMQVMWVPPDIADELANQLNQQLAPSGISVSRSDWAQYSAIGIEVLQLIVIGAAVGMFILGALGLVNINLVTMNQRVREIGIRRSYGATTGRVFFGVLLESVVATFVTGVIGVMVTVLLLQLPILRDWLAQQGLHEPQPFPLVAALIGIGASTLVGALAGALPALKATRVQIIDAIRY